MTSERTYRVWLAQLGEPLPGDAGSRRFRTGVLAEALAARGHDVTWWTSAFSHQMKIQRAADGGIRHISEHYRIRLLEAPGYRRNISVGRLRFHSKIAARFTQYACEQEPPDIIHVGFPTPSFARAAIEYAERHSVPVAVDVRDIWPDLFEELVPKILRPLTLPGFDAVRRINHSIFSKCSSIVATSPSYLTWAQREGRRAPSPRDIVVPIGYRRTELQSEVRDAARQRWKRRGVREDSFVSCFFGTMNRHFDFSPVLEAAHLLESAHPGQFQFVLCGDGPDRERLRRSAGGLANVIMPGWVDQADIIALMGVAKAGLAPYSENAKMSLPNKPYEYFAGGLPVLSSLKGDLEALLKDEGAGITYLPSVRGDLSRNIHQLAREPWMRQELSLNATRLFETRFSADLVSERLAEHLLGIVKKQQ